MSKKLLMISTDRKIFEEGSAVRARQVEYAKGFDEVHIIIFAPRTFTEQAVAPNCWVYPTRSISKFLRPLDASRLGRFIIEKRGITEVTCQDASLTAMAGVSLKKRFNLPLEIQVHEDLGSPNYTYDLAHRIRKSLALSHLPKADSIRVVSERIKKYLVEMIGIDPNKIIVRPIEVNTDQIKNAPIKVNLHEKYPQFEKIVLMVSRLEPEKNIELAIKSWPTVIKKLPKAGLVIVGSGSQKGKLKHLVNRMNLNDSVILAVESWGAGGMLNSYYKTADLYLNTSLFEGFGMTFIEARAAGLPIVSTDVGVAKENGAVIASYDPEDVARAIIESLSIKKPQ